MKYLSITDLLSLQIQVCFFMMPLFMSVLLPWRHLVIMITSKNKEVSFQKFGAPQRD